jgi:hypothetical protein
MLDVVRRTAEATAYRYGIECGPAGEAVSDRPAQRALNGQRSESFRRSRVPDALLIAPTHLPHFATQ